MRYYGIMGNRSKLLIFIEGTIMDDRAILYLKVTKHESGYLRRLPEAVPVEGAVEFCKQASAHFDIVYHGARGEEQRELYQEWLAKHGFPEGEIVVGHYKAKKLPAGILYAVDDRIQDAEEYYPKFGIQLIPVNEYCARWEKVLMIIQKSKIKNQNDGMSSRVGGTP